MFLSRNKAFKDDDVLQENIIIHLEKNGEKGPVTISTSTDDRFNDLTSKDYPVEKIVLSHDPEQFIHIPTSTDGGDVVLKNNISCTLSDLKINISTGPLVDFRLKEHLRKMPGPNTVPLLYPAHFNSKGSEWPKPDMKKPNAIHRNSETEKWLLLVESVTSHGPMDGKRHGELFRLFAKAKPGLVYVTAFPDRVTMARYLDSTAWETEVWVADAPSHLIHFDGERFLGPYK